MPALSLCPTCSTPRAVDSTCCPTCCANKRAARAAGASTLAVASLLGLSLLGAGCEGGMQADYGISETGGFDDNDGDGWSVDDGDCDDDDADINPDATETPGDGVDSNCDGEDDT